MKANREHRDQASRKSESFHKVILLRRLNITKASLLQGFALRNPFNPQLSNFELPAATEKQWHGDFGAYGIRTRDLLNAIEALYQLS
jgi:hypothetical protein